MNKFEQVFSDERQMSLAGGWRVPGSHDQGGGGGGVKEDPSGFISGEGAALYSEVQWIIVTWGQTDLWIH